MPGSENARVVLLRHGETRWSVQHRHTGRTDLPLTADGERQAAAAGPVVAGLGLRNPVIAVSPRARARRTAELAGLTGARIEPDLAEWDYGDYEGRTTPQIRADDPGWTIWTGAVPGGESADEVSARADRVLAAATVPLGERDVILVGHGHFSRALIARWLGFPVREGRRFALATAAVSVLGFEHEDPTLWAHNLRPDIA
ncbi:MULTISPECIES: acid phosphatase [Nocardia]|uniref:acid phosphatase n=1 Tax=Nocardia TaxID=1817 RepID=UPI00189441E3|nr:MULTISPECIES: acid phosphatase [Nocardia]MBF6350866.1 acid phosphatase [Nocardia flavorosea]